MARPEAPRPSTSTFWPCMGPCLRRDALRLQFSGLRFSHRKVIDHGAAAPSGTSLARTSAKSGRQNRQRPWPQKSRRHVVVKAPPRWAWDSATGSAPAAGGSSALGCRLSDAAGSAAGCSSGHPPWRTLPRAAKPRRQGQRCQQARRCGHFLPLQRSFLQPGGHSRARHFGTVVQRRGIQRTHRSFNVDRPMRHSSMVMIQKRMTTCVSFQPLFSKWWCSGAILSRRRPSP